MFKKLVEKVRSSNSFNTMKMGGENVKVIVRCRPMNRKELDMKCKVRGQPSFFFKRECMCKVHRVVLMDDTKTIVSF